jgi:hypothetical protein
LQLAVVVVVEEVLTAVDMLIPVQVEMLPMV